jgi:hypothetical protein
MKIVSRTIRRGRVVAWAAAALAVALVSAVTAAPPPSAPARAGLDLARAAAVTWAADAYLVYLENDEAVDAQGAAPRWGYLFYSPGLDQGRVYSVRGRRIVQAERFDVQLDAPPVPADWIDSDQALAAAERSAGRAFREKHQATLGTMLLMRGAFDEEQPDRTTWTVVYATPGAPSLFVVVDASDGTVRRTWRG